jgi:hypothetical protein
MGSKHHDACHAVFFPHPPATSYLMGENVSLEILTPLRDLRFPLPCCLLLHETNLIMETAITSVSNFTNPRGIISQKTESPSLSYMLSSSLETFVLHKLYMFNSGPTRCALYSLFLSSLALYVSGAICTHHQEHNCHVQP